MFTVYYFTILSILCCLLFLRCLIAKSIISRMPKNSPNALLVALAALIVFSIPSLITWILRANYECFGIESVGLRYHLRLFSWPCAFTCYSLIAYLLTSSYKQQQRPTSIQKILFSSNIALFGLYLFWMAWEVKLWVAFALARKIKLFYLTYLTTQVSVAGYKYSTKPMPPIIKKQVRALAIVTVIFVGTSAQYSLVHIPLLRNFLSIYSLELELLRNAVSLFAIYYTVQQVAKYRFLNMHEEVQEEMPPRILAMQRAMKALQNITCTSPIESHIQRYFKDGFNIAEERVHLYLRNIVDERLPHAHEGIYSQERTNTTVTVERYIKDHSKSQGTAPALSTVSILDYDEISCDKFYAQSKQTNELSDFLEAINAKLFIPIMSKELLLGYIVAQHAKNSTTLYTNVERAEMVNFSHHVGEVLNRIYSSDLGTVRTQMLELTNENNNIKRFNAQLLESINKIYTHHDIRKVGIIFYQRNEFIYGNKQAHTLCDFELAQKPTNQLMQALIQAVRDVAQCGEVVITEAYNPRGEKLSLHVVKHVSEDVIVITLMHADEKNVVEKSKQFLAKQDDWIYCLSLETTSHGRIINSLFPGTFEKMTPFKVSLLKASHTQQPAFICAPDMDKDACVEVLVSASTHTTRGILTLNAKDTTTATGEKLFGINPLFGSTSAKKALMEEYSNSTLVLENIQFLAPENQKLLADYLAHGQYIPLGSKRGRSSRVRIIVTSDLSFESLTHGKTLIPELSRHFKSHQIYLAALHNLSSHEMLSLVKSIDTQQSPGNSHDLLLTDSERRTIAKHMPASMTELRKQVFMYKAQKTSKPLKESEFWLGPESGDAMVRRAVQLGKRALNDPQLLAALWHKYGNHTLIANLLNANRNTVSRSCKDLGLAQ